MSREGTESLIEAREWKPGDGYPLLPIREDYGATLASDPEDNRTLPVVVLNKPDKRSVLRRARWWWWTRNCECHWHEPYGEVVMAGCPDHD